MLISRWLLIIATYSVLVIVPSYADTQQDSTVTVASILKDAECPLSEQQVKTLKSIKIGLGFMEIYKTLYEMFNDEQKAALIETLGPWQRYGDWLETPRFIIFIIMCENYGYPFTKMQVQRVKELPAGPPSADDLRLREGRKQSGGSIDKIFTKEQIKVMNKTYQYRVGN